MDSVNERSHMQTLGQFIEKQCDYYENLTAIRAIKDDRPIRITYGKLKQLSLELAGGMIKKGIRPGDPVCIFSDSSIEWVLAYMATQFIGAVDIAFECNRDLLQMNEIIKKTEAKMVFCNHEEMLIKLEKETNIPLVHLSWSNSNNSASKNIHNLKQLQGQGKKMIGLQQRIARYRSEREYTSACSIMFKKISDNKQIRGIVHSHQTLIQNLQNYANTIETGEHDQILSTLPLWHSSGRLALLLCFYNASSLFPSDEAGYLNDLIDIKPDILFTNPVSLSHFYKRIASGKMNESQFHTLGRRLYLKVCLAWNYITDFIFLSQNNAAQNNLFFILGSMILIVPLWFILFPLKLVGRNLYQSDMINQLGGQLNLVLCGGMELDTRIDDFFRTLGIPLLESYWITEVGFVAAGMPLEMTGQEEHRDRGTVGMALPSMELKLIDHKGNDVSTEINTPAQIYIRADNMMLGYLNEPQLTSEILGSKGWLRTGDRGMFVDSGNLKLLPRQSRFSTELL